MAKASDQNGSDCEGRKLGERTGLDFEHLQTTILVCSSTELLDMIRNEDDNSTKYPSSPSCKLCELGVAQSSGLCSIEAKAFSSPPGKYGRKAET